MCAHALLGLDSCAGQVGPPAGWSTPQVTRLISMPQTLPAGIRSTWLSWSGCTGRQVGGIS